MTTAEVAHLPELLARCARADGDALAMIVDDGPWITYAQWEARANAVARGLIERGVRRGDRVALVFDNAHWIEYAVAYFGVLKSGAAAVPLSSRLSAQEVTSALRHAGARGVLCALEFGTPAFEGLVATPAEVAEDQPQEEVEVGVGPDDLAEILYTSGTTGTPKGVAASHANLVFRYRDSGRFWRSEQRTHYLHALPVGTQAAQASLLRPLKRPQTAIVMPSFEPARYCRLVAEHAVAETILVPATASLLTGSDAHERYDLSSVRWAGVTSAAVPARTLAQLQAIFPQAEVWNIYSTTEAWPAATALSYDAERPRAVGRPRAGEEILIGDGRGRPVPAGTTGEVFLRAPGAAQREYYDDPEATKGVFLDGGWTRTGDVGYLDDDGYLFLAGRTSEVIGTGGFNVSAPEVESALHEHPDVVEAAVFGMPDDVLGERVVAVVVAPAAPSAADLRAFLRERLADYKVPTSLVFVDRLPRSVAGKVLKRELPPVVLAEAAAAQGSTSALDDTSLVDTLARIWAEELGVESVDPHDDFFELGGESLSAVRIFARIHEAVGVELSILSLLSHPTPAEQAEAIETGQHEPSAPSLVPLRPRRASTPPFVDCHSHVLPSGDDGAATIEEGIAMCSEAFRHGTAVLFATPHVWPHLRLSASRERAVRAALAAVAAQVELELRLGFELTPDERLLEEDPARYVLEGTSFVLVEVPFFGPPDLLVAVGEHVERAGLRPIVAHPERAEAILAQPALADELAARGWLLQVNGTSLLALHGLAPARLAWSLVDEGKAALVASDAHHALRPAHLDEAFRLVQERAGGELATRLFTGAALGLAPAPLAGSAPSRSS